jgi:hypothetical protein
MDGKLRSWSARVQLIIVCQLVEWISYKYPHEPTYIQNTRYKYKLSFSCYVIRMNLFPTKSSSGRPSVRLVFTSFTNTALLFNSLYQVGLRSTNMRSTKSLVDEEQPTCWLRRDNYMRPMHTGPPLEFTHDLVEKAHVETCKYTSSLPNRRSTTMITDLHAQGPPLDPSHSELRSCLRELRISSSAVPHFNILLHWVFLDEIMRIKSSVARIDTQSG